MTFPLRKRTPFARWMWERGLTNKDAVIPLGKSWEMIRQYMLDFDDPKRVIPSREVLERIKAFTGGEILPPHFYEPEQVKPADEDWHAKGFLDVGEAV